MDYFDCHIHTSYSSDSSIRPQLLLKVAKKRGLSGIAVTDHGTVKGGIQTRKLGKSTDLIVVSGSEIKTESCEILGLFIEEDIKADDPISVIEEIKAQGGLSVLAHPFRSSLIPRLGKSKTLPREVFSRVDVIETYNMRCRNSSNRLALKSAETFGKPGLSGSDAHLCLEVGKTRTSFPDFRNEEELKSRILEGKGRTEVMTGGFTYALPCYILSSLYGRFRNMSRSGSRKI